ncbi:MAG: exodeoxyribonuclease III [Pseudomonadota bacterium]
MRIVSFNVNSVRQRLPHLAEVVAQHDPDVIGLQETKVADESFPHDELASLGYHVVFHGQKTHYGVALLSKASPRRVYKGFVDDDADAQRRWIGVEIAAPDGVPLTVYNGYFPQGDNRAHPTKFPAKAAFYARVLQYLTDTHSPNDAVVVMGDFNVAPGDSDIGLGEDNAKRWLRTGKASFLPEERSWFDALLAWGLVDTYRVVHPNADAVYSWFDYRSRGFEREPKRGLRIDLILATAALAARTSDAGSDYAVRAMAKPSDHCPVWSHWHDR